MNDTDVRIKSQKVMLFKLMKRAINISSHQHKGKSIAVSYVEHRKRKHNSILTLHILLLKITSNSKKQTDPLERTKELRFP